MYWDQTGGVGDYNGTADLINPVGNSRPRFVIGKIIWSDAGKDTIEAASLSAGALLQAMRP